MWIAYVDEFEISDVKSVFQRLQRECANLLLDAIHESIYRMRKYFTMEVCERLLRDTIEVRVFITVTSKESGEAFTLSFVICNYISVNKF